MKRTLSPTKAGIAFVLLSACAACGSDGASDDAAPKAGANDGGADTGVTGGGDAAAADDGHAADGKNPGDVGNTGGNVTLSPFAVNLGTAGLYAILAKSGVSAVPPSVVTGNLGVSPIAATSITGFGLQMDASNVFATSPQVTGRVYASDYALPTPSRLTTAIGDMQTAFTDAAGRAPKVTELGAGNIGGMTLGAGVYKWGTGLLIPTDLTLNGGADDVWIFQVAQGLTVSSAAKVVLTGGAVARNVFWQISGAADVGTTAHVEGVVLSQTGIALHTGASINGRLLAQTAVTIDAGTVTEPR